MLQIRLEGIPICCRTPQEAPVLFVLSIREHACGRSEFELLAVFQCRLDSLAHVFQALAERTVNFPATAATGIYYFMGKIEGGHDRYSVEADDSTAVANLTHLAIQQVSRIEQSLFFISWTGDLVLLFQDADGDTNYL